MNNDAADTLIRVSAKTAADLAYLSKESENHLDTIIADLIEGYGGLEMASIRLFHDHHEPQDTPEFGHLEMDGYPLPPSRDDE